MFWVFIILFLLVIGAKYYTAVGTRNLERRLHRVKTTLEGSRNRLREERERQASVAVQVELTELRVRYMKELMQDIQIRLAQSSVQPRSVKEEIASAVMRF